MAFAGMRVFFNIDLSNRIISELFFDVRLMSIWQIKLISSSTYKVCIRDMLFAKIKKKNIN